MEEEFKIEIDIIYIKNSKDGEAIQRIASAVAECFGRSQVQINAVEAPNQTALI